MYFFDVFAVVLKIKLFNSNSENGSLIVIAQVIGVEQLCALFQLVQW